MNGYESSFFKLEELLTEDEQHNLRELLIKGRKTHRMQLRSLPVES